MSTMKYISLLKKTLLAVLAAGVVLGTSVPVYCTEGWYNDTNVQEHIDKVEEQLKSMGYTLNRTMGNNSSSQSAPTENTTPKEGSSKTVKSCDHIYVDSIIKEPTCSELGMMESKCSKCGDTYKTEIPATGKHDYSSEVTKEPTCTEKGETTYTCKVCGDSYTEEIPMVEHSYDSSITKDPSCTEFGIRTYTCSLCGNSYTEDIPATGHVEVEEITKEAGAFSSGEKIVKCSVCGEVLSTEVIPAKYPVSYLYVMIACAAFVIVAVVILVFRKKKHGIKTWRKSA